MFRMLKLKPPHGWNAVGWELAIVTLGVLLALAAQQWADNRDRQQQMDISMAALRDELAKHYGYAVEYRVVYPCLQAQLDRLRSRVLASGATNDPAPYYGDYLMHYVIRQPSKVYPTDAWQAAVTDGTTLRLDGSVRRALAGHYGQLQEVWEINKANNASEEGFVALTHKLPLDPTVRYSIIKEIEQMRGRFEYMDFENGQIIDYLQKAHMIPPPEKARADAQRYGTYQFCKAQGLPMRSFEEAMVAVPN